MFTEDQMQDVEASVSQYLHATKMQPMQDWRDDLTQETYLVLLEGYGGARVEGKVYFAVQMAAARLGYSNACEEDTGHDFSAEEGSVPSGRRNTEDDFVQQMEVDDWRDNKLNGYQNDIVSLLLEGHSQEDIARRLGVSQQTISRRVVEIREIAKESFDVN